MVRRLLVVTALLVATLRTWLRAARRKQELERPELPKSIDKADVQPSTSGWDPSGELCHPGARNMVLFSDGTGNSSGKLFKTNVWRLYEAVDLGPSSAEGREQIAYYDDGVGTSGFKPLAILGGVFGYGLKRNVLDIYRFACRNYRPGPAQMPGEYTPGQGDLIYGFGFSRGAFTMRLAIALIADQGLVPYTSERELTHRAAAAYRAFCATGRVRYWFSPMRPVRWIFGGMGHLWRLLKRVPRYDKHDNYCPTIRFVGVWDTVSAYGGPIAELTRAIDNWIYPLSMPNYDLNPRVQRARHALALDDERDSFHPLLWDEVAEEDLIGERGKDPEVPSWVDERRLEQVWFTGMHADVGGGYPDESLSFVSLLWMIEEANHAELRTLDTITERYRALASSLGPIHDSRAGLGSYYRYQPRRIAAWLDPEPPQDRREGSVRGESRAELVRRTLSLRDPSIEHDDGRPKGHLRTVKVHESVIARMVERADYAPFVLPPTFEIVPPGKEGETKPQKDSESEAPASARPQAPLLDPGVRTRLSSAVTADVARALEPIWNLVWLRRATYFLALSATILLVTMPLWINVAPEPPFLSDGRTWISGVIGLLGLILPSFLEGLVDVYSNNAFYFLLLVVMLLLLRAVTIRSEVRLRDATRRIWNAALARAGAAQLISHADSSIVTKVRNSAFYQRGVQVLKWHVLPFLVGLLLLAVLAIAGAAAWTQTWLPFAERGSQFCRSADGAKPIAVISRDFRTNARCNAMRAEVERGATYEITFDVVEEWRDGTYPATPEGLQAGELGVAGYVGVPFRRVVGSRYLQPMVEIRPKAARPGRLENVFIYPLELRREGEGGHLYRGVLKARRDGQLFLFSNDAVLPGFARLFGEGLDWFYRPERAKWGTANSGTACVIIRRIDQDDRQPVKVIGRVCRAAATLSAEREKVRNRAAQAKDGRPAYLAQ